MDSTEYHLEVGDGKALARTDTIGATVTERADVYVRSGATAEGSPSAIPATDNAGSGNSKSELKRYWQAHSSFQDL